MGITIPRPPPMGGEVISASILSQITCPIQRLSQNSTLYRQKINEMYRRVKCYHYMGVWSYNSWIISNWIHWKSRYIPIRNRGHCDGPEHCDEQAHELLTVCEGTWTSWRKMTCLLHRFQGLCMTHTTLYIRNNAYYIQIFTLCNCIIYISTLTYRRVTHKLMKDGPERHTVTDLNDCLWRTSRPLNRVEARCILYRLIYTLYT